MCHFCITSTVFNHYSNRNVAAMKQRRFKNAKTDARTQNPYTPHNKPLYAMLTSVFHF
jgi:hypothetical protein